MDWQPIETAPRDGSSVLLWASICGDHGKDRQVHLGNWCEPTGATFYGWPAKEAHDGWWSVEGEIDGRDGYECLEYFPLVPTHWMPLPEPPKDPA